VIGLVYVVDVYRMDYSFTDADIEVTFQYKEAGTDKVDIARIPNKDLGRFTDSDIEVTFQYKEAGTDKVDIARIPNKDLGRLRYMQPS
jgi:hypothetical protein